MAKVWRSLLSGIVLGVLLTPTLVACSRNTEPEPSADGKSAAEMRPGARRMDGKDFSNR